MRVDRVRDPVHPHQQHVRADDRDQHDRDEHDVPHQHLAEVHHVEERADPDRVERVLAAGGDPLRVEVLLRHIAGEALHHRGHERDHPGDPGPRPAAAPGRHPELAPQVDDQQRHEQLDAPQVQAVEKMPDLVVMPPVRTAQRQGEPAHDRHPERGQGAHAEHVDPGRDVSGLAVGQQLGGRQRPQRAAPKPGRPHARRPVIGQFGRTGRVRTGRVRACSAVRTGIGNGDGLRTTPGGEREQQRGPEDRDHDGDQDQVGDSDVED